MGLMDKFKNLFTDEEIIEEDDIEEPVKIKEIKKEENAEDKLPTFMREKIEKEEKNKEVDDSSVRNFEIKKEIELSPKKEIEFMNNESNVVRDNEFKFPVFDDSDFVPSNGLTRQARHNSKERENVKSVIKKKTNDDISKPSLKSETKVSELYKDKRKSSSEEKKFRATPIISPIYGVLDKNYVPDEVETNVGDNYEINRHSKNVDFDSVRKKAYGNLSDDIRENLMCENCEYLKKAKACKKNKKFDDNNLMYEALCEVEEKANNDDITLDEATENYFDYGVEYEKNNEKSDSYINLDDDDSINIVNHVDTDDTKNKEIPPVKSSINLLSTLKKSMGEEKSVNNNKEEKDLELTDDLFNLIDSMYDERSD